MNNPKIVQTKLQNTPKVSVVLPIYRDVEMTSNCIASALPSIIDYRRAKLVLINDASPDEGMQKMLETWTKQYPDTIRLLVNDHNLGFVKTVNKGMKYREKDDVILLNSDVVLPNDWLKRLVNDAYQSDNIASVTPLSNNTTICTFPEFLQDNPVPFGLDVQAVDNAFKVGRYPCVDAPTGVGFCMYIPRHALSVLGYFDADTFGRGYGEENDFCQRAIKKGYRNLISPNLYAFHLGGVSFGDEKIALIENACRIIDHRYPCYHSDVQSFILKDALREARIKRLMTLMSQTDQVKILHITHGTGGGVDQHIEELSDFLCGSAISLMLSPCDNENWVKLSLSTNKTSDSLYFNMLTDEIYLYEVLIALQVSLIHFHHTYRLPTLILDLPAKTDIPHIFTVHDFYLMSGNPTLSNRQGVYPGYFDEAVQNPLYPYPQNTTREQFRQQYRKLIEAAELVVFPSYATENIFKEVYSLDNTLVVTHLEHLRTKPTLVNGINKKARYTIGVIGAVSREKGADLLEAIAIYAHQNQLPLRFVILGYAYRTLKFVETTGPYERHNLKKMCQEQSVDMCFFPARWPETYSYTLSYAMHLGIPIFAPDIGAFSERLSERHNTALFNHLSSAQDIAVDLYQFIQNIISDQHIVAPYVEQQYTNDSESFYQTSYLNYAKQIERRALHFDTGSLLDMKMPPKELLNYRDKLVVKLWKLYSHSSMRWVNYVVPFRMRRAIKRKLSRQAIHDLVNKYDG